MLYWVMYDISETKKRSEAVRTCKNKGLYRVQKSVFLGQLSKAEKEDLKIIMERLVDEETDSIFIFPSSTEYLYDTDLIGKGFNKDFVSNERISRFL